MIKHLRIIRYFGKTKPIFRTLKVTLSKILLLDGLLALMPNIKNSLYHLEDEWDWLTSDVALYSCHLCLPTKIRKEIKI